MAMDENRGRRPNSLFRIMLDFAMGILYVIIAVFVFTTKQFGTIELTPVIVYALGGLLVVYGAFRMYRAIAAFRNNR